MNAVIQKIKTDKPVVLFVSFSILVISLFLQYEFNLKQSLFFLVGIALGLTLMHAMFGFSGGWRMRVMLAKLLLEKPSLLMLDEPTNHLDLPSIQWVESYLNRYDGAIIIVSHDQQFMDKTVNQIVEVSGHNLVSLIFYHIFRAPLNIKIAIFIHPR